jgi:3' terminal RNA ribose 2'-O-methyltransferase Hen1
LATHPEKDQIAARYLKRRGTLVKSALLQLAREDDAEEVNDERDTAEETLEVKANLHELRLAAVLAALQESGAKRILDLGCGEGKLLRLLAADARFTEVVGLDISVRSLEIASQKLARMRLPVGQAERIKLIHGALTYRDERIEGFDAAAVVEVVEHLDPSRLEAFARVLFGCARPRVIVLTTPNREYNAKFENLPAGKFRHGDHRFEWTRAEFAAWCAEVRSKYGYTVRIGGIGEEDSTFGSPSQMGVFERTER